MYRSIKIFLAVFLGFFLLSSAKPQKTTVKLTSHKGKTITFKIKKQNLEWVNGQLNLSLLSFDNKLIQLNNIKEEWLRDTTFRNNEVSYLLIDSNHTFLQNNRLLPLIEIECKQPEKGKNVFIRAHGRVYYNKIWYTVTFNYIGILPDKQFINNN